MFFHRPIGLSRFFEKVRTRAHWPLSRYKGSVLALFLLASFPSYSEEEGLKLGILSFRPEEQMRQQWQPLVNYLQQQINQPISLHVYGFQELERAVATNQLDLVITNSAHYVSVRARNPLTGPLATMIRQQGDVRLSHFGGVMFMRADDPEPENLQALARLRMVSVTPGSFGGHQMQIKVLVDAGLSIPSDRQLFSTGMPHDAVVEAVLEGRADVGFVRTGVLEDMESEGRLAPGLVRVVNQQHYPDFPYQVSTPLYPEWPVVMMPHVDEDLSRQIVIALFSLQPDTEAAKAAGIYGFTRPADYMSVEALLRDLRLPPFEAAPEFTLLDLWHRYQAWIIALGLLFGLLILTGIALVALNRRIRKSQQTLAEFSQNFEGFLNQTTDLVYFKDLQGRLVFCSQTFAELAGYMDWHDMIGQSEQALNLPEGIMQLQAGDNEVLQLAEPDLNLMLCLQIGQASRWLMTNKWPLFNNQQQLVGVFAMSRDISEMKQAEASLKLAASVFVHAREGIIITDPNGDIVDVNDSFTRITGYNRKEVLGRNPRILKSGRQSREFYQDLWHALIEKGHWYGEMWNRRKDGEVFAQMTTISAVRNEAGEVEHYVGLHTDITNLKEHQKQLEHIAHYDVLTNLPNRALLADRLQQAMLQTERRESVLAVVFLDLDGFKIVNDTYGHEVGDQLLIQLSQKMKQALRKSDTLARIGGDEFVVVLTDLEQASDCEPLLHRLLEATSSPVMISDNMLQVSASIGVTLYPSDAVEAEQLIRHADLAMYQAKQSGKNRYHYFDVERDKMAQTHHESQQRIQQALDNHEFVLYYQPKVNMHSGEVIGAEALIRWQHPQRGLLLPIEFLPLTENHPLSADIDDWVLSQAIAQLASWWDQGLKITVSVNIGARMLQQLDFVDRLKQLLSEFEQVPPSALELEVLETSALEDMMHVSHVIRLCQELGVNFALDDFGTGYSSLTYLRHLPAQQIKIDQSFVRDMLIDPDDLAIVSGVVGLASAFHRQVIAEGVESVAHGELLLLMGCDLAQGFGIAKPMPAADFSSWKADWRTEPVWDSWSTREVKSSDLALLLAEVEHRAWVQRLEAYVKNEHAMPPPMDEHHCNFGKWFDRQGQRHYSHLPAFKKVEKLHHQVHRKGHELFKSHQKGLNAQADQQLEELAALRDELVQVLRSLIEAS